MTYLGKLRKINVMNFGDEFMIYFNNDYNEAGHPAVLKKLSEYASIQMPGYGMDMSCKKAAEYIQKACNNEDVAVHFLVGGTQTNLTVIVAALRPHQAVIGAESAHINVHETGSIEATGHKVIGLASNDGKITAAQIEENVLLQRLSDDAEHIAQPKMVYLSNPTELGTIYKLNELEEIAAVCKRYGLYLFVDGARLGYGLAAKDNDVSLADLARLCDCFYIGGTKVGAMFGEAVVISNPAIAEDFRYLIKQRGGMLAKGWLLGLQFEALFENDLYSEISAHAVQLADKIRATLAKLNYRLYVPGTTNQVFVILPNVLLEELKKTFTFANWGAYDNDNTIVRFCTSWATKEENVDKLCQTITRLSK